MTALRRDQILEMLRGFQCLEIEDHPDGAVVHVPFRLFEGEGFFLMFHHDQNTLFGPTLVISDATNTLGDMAARGFEFTRSIQQAIDAILEDYGVRRRGEELYMEISPAMGAEDIKERIADFISAILSVGGLYVFHKSEPYADEDAPPEMDQSFWKWYTERRDRLSSWKPSVNVEIRGKYLPHRVNYALSSNGHRLAVKVVKPRGMSLRVFHSFALDFEGVKGAVVLDPFEWSDERMDSFRKIAGDYGVRYVQWEGPSDAMQFERFLDEEIEEALKTAT